MASATKGIPPLFSGEGCSATPSPLKSGGAALVLAILLAPAAASERKPGLSAFGDLAYPANFQHFAYANPDAPKGGDLQLVETGAGGTIFRLTVPLVASAQSPDDGTTGVAHLIAATLREPPSSAKRHGVGMLQSG